MSLCAAFSGVETDSFKINSNGKQSEVTTNICLAGHQSRHHGESLQLVCALTRHTRRIPQRVPLIVLMCPGVCSQRNVGMLLPGVDLLLARQHLQVSADLPASGRRLDDVIDKP